jgi:thioredoxin 1
MATVTLTLEDFESTIEQNDTVFVDFWAAWCGPCRAFGPVFEEASDNHPDAVFAKVDTEDQQELAGYLGITSIPTLMVFREKVLVFAEAGALPPRELENVISQVNDLEMAKVHEMVEEAKRKEHQPEEA